MFLLVLDADRAEADLNAGRPVCSYCADRLRPWGWPSVDRSERRVAGCAGFGRGGRAVVAAGARRPAPGLVSASPTGRRPDRSPLREGQGVGRPVLTALTRAATGAGHRPIAAELGVPAATVRGWLRHARVRAQQVRCVATVAAHRVDPMLGPIEQQGSALADAVEALGLAAAAIVRRGLWPVPPDPATLLGSSAGA